ncbi:MAG: leucine-rich repeat domain-containing protein [Oscillospiraceae bacterium]|nr:leucine-rich repeat domain-containing protein [Oscillospiraceae bacterium]
MKVNKKYILLCSALILSAGLFSSCGETEDETVQTNEETSFVSTETEFVHLTEEVTQKQTESVTNDVTDSVTDVVTNSETDIVSTKTVSEESASLQKCGDNAFWIFDSETETLIISGTGDIYDYGDWGYGGEAPPWNPVNQYATNVKHAVIQEGITGIGSSCFLASGLVSVRLPETLERIGALAFHNCSDLKEITIPKNVKTIDDRAFAQCGNGDIDIVDSFTVYGYSGSSAERYVDEINSLYRRLNNGGKTPVKFASTGVSEQLECTETDYKKVYKDFLDGICDRPDITKVLYTLYDMNKDEIPELITITGTCEADSLTDFYTVRNNQAVLIGGRFGGSHRSFDVDADTGQLCLTYGHMGSGGITWYSFDGTSVFETNSVTGIDYTSDDVDESFAKYANLKYQEKGYLFDLGDEWNSYYYTEDNKPGEKIGGRVYYFE